MARKRNRLLVPEAREALDALMRATSTGRTSSKSQIQPHDSSAANRNHSEEVVSEVAQNLGIPYQPNGYNGQLTTRDAGRIGGQMGGTMVQRLIEIAKSELSQTSMPGQAPPNKLHH